MWWFGLVTFNLNGFSFTAPSWIRHLHLKELIGMNLIVLCHKRGAISRLLKLLLPRVFSACV
ncbi:MAG TPA: hypothetical protein PKZ54_09695 [Syntrophorhabdaceae bacterium]|nr:hypothetical protein [Syntrophorhabdaceae bacterium]